MYLLKHSQFFFFYSHILYSLSSTEKHSDLPGPVMHIFFHFFFFFLTMANHYYQKFSNQKDNNFFFFQSREETIDFFFLLQFPIFGKKYFVIVYFSSIEPKPKTKSTPRERVNLPHTS